MPAFVPPGSTLRFSKVDRCGPLIASREALFSFICEGLEGKGMVPVRGAMGNSDRSDDPDKRLFQGGELGLRLLVDWSVGIGVVPKPKKLAVGSLCFVRVAIGDIGTGDSKTR
jgi:hypothetical protein